MICDVVIPALDEHPNIRPLMEALAPWRGRGVRHVIVADNGSTDGTPDEAAACGAVVVREARRGYGAACLAALAWICETGSPPEAVVFLDADLSDDPAGLPELLAPLRAGAADLVIGSRVRRAEPGALNLVQRFGNGLACALMAALSGRRYSDLGPFRAIRWSTLERLAMADRTWGWTVEMQMKAALLDIPAQDVDVAYRTRRTGRSKISGTVRGVLAAGTKIITTIVALWWRRGELRRR
ncbi:MAG: glycosyltransferase family 2 protein [Planctomycetes bacterium]|nr:glycosyltransferase family 2 protein [Planctomycetota bacterium]